MKKTLLFVFTIAFISSCEKKINKSIITNAINQDNLSQFEKITSKINLDTCKFNEGRSALNYALQIGSTKIAHRLIDNNFMLNESDSLNLTPLILSILKKNDEATNKLLEKKINLNTIDYLNGYSALHYAINNKDLKLVKKLIHKKADINLKTESIMSSTPLHMAIEDGNSEIVKILLDNNAIDTIKDVNDHTAIDLVSRTKNIDIIKMFYPKMNQNIKEKLFTNIVRGSGNIDFLNKILNEKWMTKTIINDAFVFSRDTLVSKQLLNKGASIKKLHSEYGYGAIHYGAIRGDTIMLSFLLKNGANINQLAKEGSVSPLMYAAQLNDQAKKINERTKELSIGVNAFFYDLMGKSIEKNRQNSLEAVKFLVDRSANLNFKNKLNENVLYYAESSFNTEVSEYLKNKGIKETKKFIESKSNRLSRILDNIR